MLLPLNEMQQKLCCAQPLLGSRQARRRLCRAVKSWGSCMPGKGEGITLYRHYRGELRPLQNISGQRYPKAQIYTIGFSLLPMLME